MKLPNIPLNGIYAILTIIAFTILGLGYFHVIENDKVETVAEQFIKSRTGLEIELPGQTKKP